MPGRDDFRGYRSDWDERRRQEMDRDQDRRFDERRSFGRYNSDEARYGTEGWRDRLGDYPGDTGQAEAWRSERAGSRYDQDRTRYSRGGRPEWQDRDWEGGSPGLSHGYEADERRMEERRERDFGAHPSRSFRRPEDFGYGGQEYGMEARGQSEFARSPGPVQRVTDAEDENWRDRFGDDGRPHPRFEDDRERGRSEQRFGRREEHRGGMFGGRDDRDSWFGRHDEERRFGRRDDERGHMRWRDQGGAYGDTRLDREDRGMAEYGVPHDYGYHESVDPFEAEASRRRQDEVRRRADEDRRRRADLERRENVYRSGEGRLPWDRDW